MPYHMLKYISLLNFLTYYRNHWSAEQIEKTPDIFGNFIEYPWTLFYDLKKRTYLGKRGC